MNLKIFVKMISIIALLFISGCYKLSNDHITIHKNGDVTAAIDLTYQDIALLDSESKRIPNLLKHFRRDGWDSNVKVQRSELTQQWLFKGNLDTVREYFYLDFPRAYQINKTGNIRTIRFGGYGNDSDLNNIPRYIRFSCNSTAKMTIIEWDFKSQYNNKPIDCSNTYEVRDYLTIAVVVSISEKTPSENQLVVSNGTNDTCHDLWYARNFIMDKVGFCFGSVLGKLVFNNSNCNTKQPQLSSIDQARVKEILSHEQSSSCKVNTRGTKLNINLFKARHSLKTQPLNDGHESSCIGYKGKERIPLYSDTDLGSEILGYILTGDDLAFNHIPYENTASGWQFVSGVSKDEQTVPILGWTNSNKLNQCEQFAG